MLGVGSATCMCCTKNTQHSCSDACLHTACELLEHVNGSECVPAGVNTTILYTHVHYLSNVKSSANMCSEQRVECQDNALQVCIGLLYTHGPAQKCNAMWNVDGPGLYIELANGIA